MNVNVEEEVSKRAERITRDDMKGLLSKETTAHTLAKKAEFLSAYWEDIKTSFSLLRDWFNGTYDQIPSRMIASLAGALIYFISPVDLIPDWIPMAGFLDDAAILAAVFKLSEADLKFYRRWKRKQRPEEDAEVSEDAVEVVDV